MLANTLDLFREWDAILGTILVVHLRQVSLIMFCCSKALMRVLTFVELMNIMERLLPEYKSRRLTEKHCHTSREWACHCLPNHNIQFLNG